MLPANTCQRLFYLLLGRDRVGEATGLALLCSAWQYGLNTSNKRGNYYGNEESGQTSKAKI
jgi:hypothetical protein